MQTTILPDEKVLVTGVSGFIGHAIARKLLDGQKRIIAPMRRPPNEGLLKDVDEGFSWIQIGDINGQTEWRPALEGAKIVVHCAAYAHTARNPAGATAFAYRDVNVSGTLRLAQQAAFAGIRRFVFLSSIKVNGECTPFGQPFTEASMLAPQDAYGQSKADAELGLMSIAQQTGMEVVIIRPPLVVGPGVKGNFASLLGLVRHGIPIPFGAVHNTRSLVSLDNLVSLVLLCADRTKSPQAANQVFVVSDGEDVSTTILLRKIALAAGRSSRLLPVPMCLLRAVATLLGRSSIANRLLGNLQVDSTKAKILLGWSPVVTLDEQLAAMFKPRDPIN